MKQYGTNWFCLLYDLAMTFLFGEDVCQGQTNAFQNSFESDTEIKGPVSRKGKNLDS